MLLLLVACDCVVLMSEKRAAKVQTSKGEDTAEEEEDEERRDRAAVRQVRTALPLKLPHTCWKSPRSSQAEETQGMEAGSLEVKSKVWEGGAGGGVGGGRG